MATLYAISEEEIERFVVGVATSRVVINDYTKKVFEKFVENVQGRELNRTELLALKRFVVAYNNDGFYAPTQSIEGIYKIDRKTIEVLKNEQGFIIVEVI